MKNKIKELYESEDLISGFIEGLEEADYTDWGIGKALAFLYVIGDIEYGEDKK